MLAGPLVQPLSSYALENARFRALSKDDLEDASFSDLQPTGPQEIYG